jgi:hypothetical protein
MIHSFRTSIAWSQPPNGFSAYFGKECPGTLSPDQPKKTAGNLAACVKP